MNKRELVLDIAEKIKNKDKEAIKKYIEEKHLFYSNGKIILSDELKEFSNAEESHYGRLQQAKKLLLNSTYGALLNKHMFLYSEELGQSTTLNGRNITRHMCGQIAQEIDGKYDYHEESIKYGDTDSCYFSAAHISSFPTSEDDIIQYYDDLAKDVNSTFPNFLEKNFNIPVNDCNIKAGRELVGSRALFIKKKRYGILIIDKEGKRLNTGNSPGKIKAMGLDLKRSDTNPKVQQFLENLLMLVLQGASENEIKTEVDNFRTVFNSWLPWEKGQPKKVNKLTKYTTDYIRSKTEISFDLADKINAAKKIKNKHFRDLELEKIKKENSKVNLPGHVRASINYNEMKKIHHDNSSASVTDGAKVLVCKLLKNNFNIDSIAHPYDEKNIPEWYKNLPFDVNAMEDANLHKKIENLLGVLGTTEGWNIQQMKPSETSFDDSDLFV